MTSGPGAGESTGDKGTSDGPRRPYGVFLASALIWAHLPVLALLAYLALAPAEASGEYDASARQLAAALLPATLVAKCCQAILAGCHQRDSYD
ncbi:MAG: hypothetical protein M3R38_24265 [Actinomycetota bacterium]|nr:hypothetical protein [Actinomycetota bacterium]MDP9486539.1 hypothetical protein [Actinomycetota bacterium]